MNLGRLVLFRGEGRQAQERNAENLCRTWHLAQRLPPLSALCAANGAVGLHDRTFADVGVMGHVCCVVDLGIRLGRRAGAKTSRWEGEQVGKREGEKPRRWEREKVGT